MRLLKLSGLVSLVILAAALPVLGAPAALAAAPRPSPRIDWTKTEQVIGLPPGGSASFVVQFKASAPIKRLTLRAFGPGQFPVSVSPPVLADVVPGTLQTVQVRVDSRRRGRGGNTTLTLAVRDGTTLRSPALRVRVLDQAPRPTATPTRTATATRTRVPTRTPTFTPSSTGTPTGTRTATNTPRPPATASGTSTPTRAPSGTPTPTATPSRSTTAAPIWSPTSVVPGSAFLWGGVYAGHQAPGPIFYGVPVPFGDPGQARAVAPGDHTMLLRPDGTVMAQGWNLYGQIGDGTTIDRSTLVPVAGLSDVVAIGSGNGSSLAVRRDGSLWAWGNLAGGSSSVPRPVPAPRDIVAISVGGFDVLALVADGTVWHTSAIGSADWGRVDGLHDVVAVAAGNGHFLALERDGTVWAWGRNDHGELGNGTVSDVEQIAPSGPVAGLTSVVAIAAAGLHDLVVRTDGTVWGWGSNLTGELGDDTTPHFWPTPRQLAVFRDAVAVQGGLQSTFVLGADGSVMGQGFDVYGSLGAGGHYGRTGPVSVRGLVNVRSLWVSGNQSVAIVGDGPPAPPTVPVPVRTPRATAVIPTSTATPTPTPTPTATATRTATRSAATATPTPTRRMRWQRLADMPAATSGSAAAVGLNGRVYVFGGDATGKLTQEYDPSTDTWRVRSPMPLGNPGMGNQGMSAATGVDGLIYVFGGSNDAHAILLYDPVADAWVGRRTTSANLAYAIAVAVGDDIYVLAPWSAVYVYHPATDTMSRRADRPDDLGQGAAASLGPDGRLYAVGGLYQPPYPTPHAGAVLHAYDGATDRWSPLAPLMNARANHALVLGPDGRLWVAAGYDEAGHLTPSVETYDPTSDRWIYDGEVPEPVDQPAAVRLGNDIILIGGSAAANGYNSVASVYRSQLTP